MLYGTLYKYCMFNRHREKQFTKINKGQKRKDSKIDSKSTNEMKSAFKDSKKLKRHKKRLSIGWFFRPD